MNVAELAELKKKHFFKVKKIWLSFRGQKGTLGSPLLIITELPSTHLLSPSPPAIVAQLLVVWWSPLESLPGQLEGSSPFS